MTKQTPVQYVMPFGNGSSSALEMEHRAFIKGLAKPGATILATLTPEKLHVVHMAYALMIESAELADPIKKHFIYDKPLDVDNAKEELGDILFYFEAIVDFYGFTIDQLREANMAKLRKRYPNGYSNQAAIARADKTETEAETAEGSVG